MTQLLVSRPTGSQQIVVASVPAGHVYVRHLAAEQESQVRRLPDPDPAGPHHSTDQAWLPPVMLDPRWVRNADFDVFHLQFGFDDWSPQQLREVVAALRARRKPFVYTVHELHHPHHGSRELHDAQLDVLVPAADALVTLTEGAAAEILRRWGRAAHVVPHPHVVDLADMALIRTRRRASSAGPRIGLHLESMHSSTAPARLLPTLLEFAAATAGAVLQVNGHRDVLEPSGARYHEPLARHLRGAVADGLVDLRVHDVMPDGDLFDYLASLDVSVLPHRFGTHSGWLEACRDLGTTVVAPSCGYYADQGPVLTYVHEEDRFEAATLRAALHEAVAQPGLGSMTTGQRRAQRARTASFHEGLYDDLLDRARRSRM